MSWLNSPRCCGLLLLLAGAAHAADMSAPPAAAGSLQVDSAAWALDRDPILRATKVGASGYFLTQDWSVGELALGVLASGFTGVGGGLAQSGVAGAHGNAEEAKAGALNEGGKAVGPDIETLLDQALRSAAPGLQSAATPRYGARGAVWMWVRSDKRVFTTLLVEVRSLEAEHPWSGYYYYHFNGIGDAALFGGGGTADFMARVSEELKTAAARLAGVIASDLGGRLPGMGQVRVHSDELLLNGRSGGWKAERLAQTDESITLRIPKPVIAVGGVHMFQAGQYQLAPVDE